MPPDPQNGAQPIPHDSRRPEDVSPTEKILQMFTALGLFAAFIAVLLFAVSRVRGRASERAYAVGFVGPTMIMLAVGLVYPAVLTIIGSFKNAKGTQWVGFENYVTLVSEPEYQRVLINTFIWTLLVPIAATAIGLLYAVLVDRTRTEAFSKALVFLPMAISMVGAGIIWKFVYEYKPTKLNQIGLANQILKWMGLDTYQFLITDPWNTFFLIVVMIWIQAGFAMTVLSASIKGIPDDIIEAAKLDGVSSMQMFRKITIPSIRPGIIVVVTTIAIGTLKVFDVVRTMTGGQFKTSVVANEFYNQSFRYDNDGLGAALAVLLFVLVIPIVAYNITQLRKAAN
jgi:alpha-glucoside transport system permease protein